VNVFKLYSYWRSSSAYRVRIALNLKNAAYEIVPVHLLREGGEQYRPEYRALNPQALVPLLADGDFLLAQSLAIFHYLEERLPQPPLVPQQARAAARMWAFCLAIACEIQPLQNTRVVRYLEGQLGADEAQRSAWLRHWIGAGLAALEAQLAAQAPQPYCFGEQPTYADCCLIPQLYAARRYAVPLAAYRRLLAVEARCQDHEAFRRAAPETQPDAPSSA
jgi:maleylacetoacetate isomerase